LSVPVGGRPVRSPTAQLIVIEGGPHGMVGAKWPEKHDD
jgi:hypothetical protein